MRLVVFAAPVSGALAMGLLDIAENDVEWVILGRAMETRARNLADFRAGARDLLFVRRDPARSIRALEHD